MIEENKISFSANGLYCSLSTVYGEISFTTSEFSYYQSFFKIIDIYNNGKLKTNSSQLNYLLLRTNIEHSILQQAISLIFQLHSSTSAVTAQTNVTIIPANPDNYITLNYWLMLCKLLAFHQENKSTINDKLFRTIHSTKLKIPFLQFHLLTHTNIHNHTQLLSHKVVFHKTFESVVTEWQYNEDDIQNHHVKFKIHTKATLRSSLNINGGDNMHINGAVANSSSVAKSSSSSSNNVKNRRDRRRNSAIATTTTGSSSNSTAINVKVNDSREEYVVERRYSEFESFAQILQKNYQCIIIPPLPLKSFSFLSIPELVAKQRAYEFQKFLDDLTVHPILRNSFELYVFLECSSLGFKSFLELYSHMKNGVFDYSNMNYSLHSHPLTGVSKLISSSTAAVTTGASLLLTQVNQSQARNISYFASVWDTINKNVQSSISILSYSSNPHNKSTPIQSESDVVAAQTKRFLEEMVTLGGTIEQLLTAEKSCQLELSKIAQCLKYMSEFETIPDLTRIFTISSGSVGTLYKSQKQFSDSQHLNLQISTQYLGRYSHSYQHLLQHRSNLHEKMQQAARSEHASRRAVTLLETEQSNSPLDASIGSRTDLFSGSNRTVHEAKFELEAAEQEAKESRDAVTKIDDSLIFESNHLKAIQISQFTECIRSVVASRVAASRTNLRAWQDLKKELQHI